MVYTGPASLAIAEPTFEKNGFFKKNNSFKKTDRVMQNRTQQFRGECDLLVG